MVRSCSSILLPDSMHSPNSSCKPHRETSSTSAARFSKLRGLITVNLPIPAAGTLGSLRRSLRNLCPSAGAPVSDMMPERSMGSEQAQYQLGTSDYRTRLPDSLDQRRRKDDPVDVQIAPVTGMRPENSRDANERQKQHADENNLAPPSGQEHSHDPKRRHRHIRSEVNGLDERLPHRVESPGKSGPDLAASALQRQPGMRFHERHSPALVPAALLNFTPCQPIHFSALLGCKVCPGIGRTQVDTLGGVMRERI